VVILENKIIKTLPRIPKATCKKRERERERELMMKKI
jgi:hypothetical protein